MIKKTKTGWRVDIRPNRTDAIRYRKTFKTQTEAHAFERWAIAEHQKKDWLDKPKDDRRLLSDLVGLWYSLHGVNNKWGEGALEHLTNTCNNLGNPVAKDLTANRYIKYRADRLKRVTKGTVNNELAYLKAVYNYLSKIDEIDYINPLAKISKLKKDEQELSFLSIEQIRTLLDALDSKNSDAGLVARVCLATGARWGETISLRPQQVGADSITFVKTKGGKNRTLPIDGELAKAVRRALSIVNPFKTFQRVIADLGFDLPKGQLTHVLRHSFTSHMVMQGVDILTVQKSLGHSNLTMTMRYAHLSPNHLMDALKNNPLALSGQKLGNSKKAPL